MPHPDTSQSSPPPAPTGHFRFFQRTLIVVGTLLGLALVWQLSDVLLLLFGSILITLVLFTAARFLCQRTRLPFRLALALTILLLFGAVGGGAYLFGSETSEQVDQLTALLPDAWRAVQARLESNEIGRQILARIGELSPSGTGVASTLSWVFSMATGIVSGFLLVVVGGIYLAIEPRLYLDGLLHLVPASGRPLAQDTLATVGRALRLWLLGQLAAMAAVGFVTGLGLYLLGVPSWLALGLIAGLLEFIPFAGPIIAALPALVIAATLGTDMLIYVALLYLGIQQLEGNLITPLIQRQAVDLPPALTIFAIFALGSIFGTPGIVLAAPLTVVIYVAVKKLYVRELLEERTSIPGEEA